MFIHETEHGALLCKSEDISCVPADKLAATAHLSRIDTQHKSRLLLGSGLIIHCMGTLPVIEGVHQASDDIGGMISLCDQQGYNPPQPWLVNAREIVSIQPGVAPEFLGYPHFNDKCKPSIFTVVYRDGTRKTFRQTITNLPEDVSVITVEVRQ